MPAEAHFKACSKSTSLKMIVGLFPPNSRVTFFKLVSEAALRILRPVRVLPVNATFEIFMCSAMAWPTLFPRECLQYQGQDKYSKTLIPYPLMMLKTPGGNPASTNRSASRRAERGVISEGLRMTAFPVERAGPNFHTVIN